MHISSCNSRTYAMGKFTTPITSYPMPIEFSITLQMNQFVAPTARFDACWACPRIQYCFFLTQASASSVAPTKTCIALDPHSIKFTRIIVVCWWRFGIVVTSCAIHSKNENLNLKMASEGGVPELKQEEKVWENK